MDQAKTGDTIRILKDGREFEVVDWGQAYDTIYYVVIVIDGIREALFSDEFEVVQ